MSLQDTAFKIQANIADKAQPNPDPSKVGAADLAEILNDHNTALSGIATPPAPEGVRWIQPPASNFTGTETASIIERDGEEVTVPASGNLAPPFAYTGGHRTDWIVLDTNPTVPVYKRLVGQEVSVLDPMVSPSLSAGEMFVRSLVVTDGAVTQQPTGAVKSVLYPGGKEEFPNANGQLPMPDYAKAPLVVDTYAEMLNLYITQPENMEPYKTSIFVQSEARYYWFINPAEYDNNLGFEAFNAINDVSTSDKTTYSSERIEALIATPTITGTLISFENLMGTVYGSPDTPETSNITLDTTNAKLGVTNLIIHNSGVEPTVEGKAIGDNSGLFKELEGSQGYKIGRINLIWCVYVSPTTIFFNITQPKL